MSNASWKNEMKNKIEESFRNLQKFICSELENIDHKSLFKSDSWSRHDGGGGITNTISGGRIIEKGGVAFSSVYGPVTEEMKSQLATKGNEFFATGVSIVLHPQSVHVPIIHMNVRYFQMDQDVYWFGGGIDLTPHYVVPENAAIFHNDLKKICDHYNSGFYDKFKAWADDYFFIGHRNETRGIGGIFFDHISHENTSLQKEEILDFCLMLGRSFTEIYNKQVNLRLDQPVTEDQRKWQQIRRGRYVEFNLVHDRGTKFGLVSGGRTESILLSMPPTSMWEYNFIPTVDSEEHKTLDLLKKGINWLEFIDK
jgi:coproporphyrinogen III oxidase